MKPRLYTSIAASIAVLGLMHNSAEAQKLKVIVNRETGEMTLASSTSDPVNFSAYAVMSGNGSLSPLDWNGVRDTEGADWEVAAGGPTVNLLTEINTNPDPAVGATATDTTTFSLGIGSYDALQGLGNIDLGVDLEQNDLSLLYYDHVQAIQTTGVVEYTGFKLANNVGITVDLTSGHAFLENESVVDRSLVGFSILSNQPGVLNTNSGSFTGLGGSFLTAPLDGTDVSQLDPSGNGTTLTADTDIQTNGTDLGVVVDTSPANLAAALDNLEFTFLLDGETTNRDGFVRYINVPVLAGDYNGDGEVNIADYTVWRDNLGASDESAINFAGDGGGITASDYSHWKTHFGDSSNLVAGQLAAGSQAVPEPASVALVLLAILPVARRSRARRMRP